MTSSRNSLAAALLADTFNAPSAREQFHIQYVGPFESGKKRYELTQVQKHIQYVNVLSNIHKPRLESHTNLVRYNPPIPKNSYSDIVQDSYFLKDTELYCIRKGKQLLVVRSDKVFDVLLDTAYRLQKDVGTVNKDTLNQEIKDTCYGIPQGAVEKFISVVVASCKNGQDAPVQLTYTELAHLVNHLKKEIQGKDADYQVGSNF